MKELGAYFDHNATTPTDPEVVEAMQPYLSWNFGNASSLHAYGVEARYAVERARRTLMKALGAPRPDTVVFTSGGTESDNIAIRGAARLARFRGRGRHVVTSAVEHKAVLDTCKDLKEFDGFDLTILPVDQWGRVRPHDLGAALREDTVLVSLMLANNEVGSISPIAELVAIVRERSPKALFHTDAVQAFGRIPVDVKSLGVDLLSLSAHKLYGPNGAGVLYIAPGVDIHSEVTGGGQERDLRPGTENVAGIAGFACAAEIALERMEEERIAVTAMREELWALLSGKIPGLIRNSPREDCLPGTLNVSFPRTSGRSMVNALAQKGFAVSAGSACTSQLGVCTAVEGRAGHVLAAITTDMDRALGAVRISLGRTNTPEQIPDLADAASSCYEALVHAKSGV